MNRVTINLEGKESKELLLKIPWFINERSEVYWNCFDRGDGYLVLSLLIERKGKI